MKLKRPQLVPNSSVVKLFREAELALQQKDFEKNMELLERARKLDPANPAILLQMGRSHGLRFNYAAAEECFEKAIQLSSHKTEIMAMAGMRSWDFFNPELTERYLPPGRGTKGRQSQNSRSAGRILRARPSHG